MLTKLLTLLPVSAALLVLAILLSSLTAFSRDPVPDTLKRQVAVVSKDTVVVNSHFSTDTAVKQDTVRADSVVKAKNNQLESKVSYTSTDSLRFDVADQKVYIYKEGKITYQNIGLDADYVEINFRNDQVFASGLPDSTGKDVGLPVFTEDDQKFKARVMTYNYKTKKGLIHKVFTQQDEGYLHGVIIKKMANNTTYIKDGSYTTCNREDHPHFEFHFGRAKVIPNDKIITGPAYLKIENMPTPLMIPFGMFPNKRGQRSGILIPTYGESRDRGFYFENGGYYWAFSQYMDIKLVGDIYTRGSWAVKPAVTYRYRYHYQGNFNFGYAINLFGVKGSPDYKRTRDFRIFWVHTQDPKARPNSNFSANVNIVSNTFNQYNPSSTQQYLSNTFQSSINYSRNWNARYFLNLNFNHSQNTLDKTISVTFPQLQFSVNQFYPFRKKESAGKLRWYDNISVRYNMNAENRMRTPDSLFLKKNWAAKMQNGMSHTVPITSTIKILKYFNMTNSINITDKMYLQSIRKSFVADTSGGHYQTDTLQGFANAFDANFSTSVNTRFYGMYQFKKGFIKAFRHVMSPSVTFTYTPDFGAAQWGFWRDVTNDTSKIAKRYSVFEGGIYGGPPSEKSGVVSFNLSNNLEMKVRNRKDTITGTKKIPLIESLIVGVSYDVAKDSMNWSLVSISGRTTLFKNLNVQYSSTWDPYYFDVKTGRRTKRFEWDVTRNFFRLENTTWNLGFNYSLSSDKVNKKKTTTHGSEQEREDVYNNWDNYVDFDVPWSFNLSYNFRSSTNYVWAKRKRVGTIVQTMNFNGMINITKKWKLSVTSGYDFKAGAFSYTSLDIYRDLHCWEMRFGWIPKGARQSWNFTINVKASVLQDLKLNKKKDFRDY